MSDVKTTRDIAPEIMLQHHQILGVIGTLGTAPPLKTLRASLAELCSLLEPHLACEEGSGGLRDVLETYAPRLLSRLDPIFDEHVNLLGTARELARRAEAASESDLSDLYRQVAGLISQIKAHEQRENGLLQEALLDDLGAND